MPPSEASFAEEHGYRILKGPDAQSFVFVDLATRGPIVFSGACGGLAVMFAVLAVSQFITYAGSKGDVPIASPVVLSVLAILCAVLAVRGVRTYFRRQTSSGKRLVLSHGRLEDERGHCLATAGELTVRTAIDVTDTTGGFQLPQLVLLHWPQGQVTVYKTFSKTRLASVVAALAQAVSP